MNTDKFKVPQARHPERSEGSKLPMTFVRSLGFFAALRMTDGNGLIHPCLSAVSAENLS